MNTKIILTKLFFATSVVAAAAWQALLLARTFPRKLKALKAALSRLILAFALASVIADPMVSRMTKSKPTSQP